MEKANLDWGNLGYGYIRTDYNFISYWKDGSWDEGSLIKENTVTISIGSTALHYGQECFEGLKAQTAKDGRVLLFRPDQNAKRMSSSAKGILMAEVPEEKFVDACIRIVNANMKWVPPYGTGAALYIRPFLFGHGDNLGVKPASEYIFCIFCSPVGPYFKGGLTPVFFNIAEYDRAAPRGTGAIKVGGNYAASMRPRKLSKEAGYADCVYLDPQTRTYIDEVGAANFFGITKDNKLVTPKSPSILPSITRRSVMEIAEKYLGMEVEQRPVRIDEIDNFVEAGACGTAAVITPVGGIFYDGKMHHFYNEGKEAGPVVKKLYDTLTGIQRGEIEAPEGWMVEVK